MVKMYQTGVIYINKNAITLPHPYDKRNILLLNITSGSLDFEEGTTKIKNAKIAIVNKVG
jgi:hypothetical protein